jgi:hypothetical protein
MAKITWLDRLAGSLDTVGGDTLRQNVMQGSDGLSSGSSPASKARWVCGMLERMEKHFEKTECSRIMNACSCTFSRAIIHQFQLAYEKSGTLEGLVAAMRAEQREDILRRVGPDEELRNRVEPEPFMHSPVLGDDGSILHIGRPYHPREYLLAMDAFSRRQHMCHCGWINGSHDEVSPIFCNCGAGFYRNLWESLVGAPVKVSVISTVFSGGQYCQMRVLLSSTPA